jgi:GntR family transcriptional regulator, transcriptional repressor for pyruvate dehydrogenase complex
MSYISMSSQGSFSTAAAAIGKTFGRAFADRLRPLTVAERPWVGDVDAYLPAFVSLCCSVMAVRQPTPTPAYQLLAEDLRTEITSGRLRTGQRLPTEPQLCARTGLSRSTVREALRLLTSQNLVITVRGVSGGSFVTQPSVTQLTDMLTTGLALLWNTSVIGLGELLEMRAMLEVPAAALAAKRRTREHLDTLAAGLFDLATDNLDDMLGKHRVFHRGITAASGNPLCELLSEPLYQIANERELVADAPAGFWARVDADHREILRCVADRDVEGSRSAAAAHVAHLRDTYAPAQPGDGPTRPIIAPRGAVRASVEQACTAFSGSATVDQVQAAVPASSG